MAYRPRSSRMRRSRSRSGLFSFLPFRFDRQQLIMYAVIGTIAMIIFGYIGAVGLFAWYGRDLPEPGKLSELRENSTIFYDRNGKVLYQMFEDKNRVPVTYEEVPEKLIQATIAIEDKDFYKHEGISKISILRAAIKTALGDTQGGSTITQQLIKNVLLTSERRLSRKVKEAILAHQVEDKYSKDEIITMYLNEAPYGGTYWGVGSAAKGYFNKDVEELSMVESAILAGLPQSPSRYSPYSGEKNAWKGRTTDVLRRMREDKYITREEEEKALEKLDSIRFSTESINATAPHFIFYLKQIIEEDFGSGLFNSGVKITTTIDADLQKEAEKIVKEEIENLKDYKVGNGALVAIHPENGDIISYVGSYDYSNEDYGKFDVVSQANRQPGSTLKPIEYATALKEGYTASTVIMDVKTTFPNQGGEDYIPENYDQKYRGPVQVRFALGNSLNVPAVKMLAMIGIRDFLQQAYDMGLNSLEPTQQNINNLGLSASLGGGETTLLDLTTAFTTFANGGEVVSPRGILEIQDFNGKSIYKAKDAKKSKVLSEDISFIISHILSDNNARLETFGTNSYLNIAGKTVAAKTGTTNDKRDNWTVGFTKDITLGVWVGNNDNSPMNEAIASGVTGASPIWHAMMQKLLSKYEDNIQPKPDSVEAAEVDAFLGGLPRDGYPTRTEYFIKGTVPTEQSPYYKRIKISKSTKKLANDVEIKNGDYDEKDVILIEESDPISTDGKNRWQEAIDTWAREQNDDKYNYPTEISDGSAEEVAIQIKEPSNNQRINSNKVKVRATITSNEKIKEIKIYINNEEKKVLVGDRDEFSEEFELSNGVYEIKVRAENEKGKSRESTVKLGVNEDVKD